MVPAHFFPLRRKPHLRLFCVMLGAFSLNGIWLIAAVSCARIAPADFPAYLARNQAELGPFFTQNGAVLVKDALPGVVVVAAHIMLVTALICCLVDVLLGWGFSTIAAPAYAKITRALIYATGRLALALVMTLVLSFTAMLGVYAGAGWPALLVALLLTVPAVALQIFWASWLYRTPARASGIFYFVLLLVHSVVGAILIPIFFAGQIDNTAARFVDDSVAPRLGLEAINTRHKTADIMSQRDTAQAQVTALQGRLAQDETDQTHLRQAIEDGKNLPAFVFSRLVLMRAQGNLTQAATGFADFIAQHPHDPEIDAARGQLVEINQAVSAQLAARQQEQAETAHADAQARAHLLARTAAGQATLSELRAALLGKTPAQVFAIFGAPSERDADRWGYSKHMVADPEAGGTRGLTVNFADGLVQGVDYYGEGR
jgi:hypothetical protein